MAFDLLCSKDSQFSLFSIAVTLEAVINKTCSFSVYHFKL